MISLCLAISGPCLFFSVTVDHTAAGKKSTFTVKPRAAKAGQSCQRVRGNERQVTTKKCNFETVKEKSIENKRGRRMYK